MIETGVQALLASDSGLEALVGPRIYAGILPDGCAMPAVVYTVAGGSSDTTFETSGLQRERFQFDAHGGSALSATQVRYAIRAALEGFHGPMAGGTFLLDAQHIQRLNNFDQDSQRFVAISEFYLLYNLI